MNAKPIRFITRASWRKNFHRPQIQKPWGLTHKAAPLCSHQFLILSSNARTMWQRSPSWTWINQNTSGLLSSSAVVFVWHCDSAALERQPVLTSFSLSRVSFIWRTPPAEIQHPECNVAEAYRTVYKCNEINVFDWFLNLHETFVMSGLICLRAALWSHLAVMIYPFPRSSHYSQRWDGLEDLFPPVLYLFCYISEDDREQ